jgi:glutamate carboxypeptidase
MNNKTIEKIIKWIERNAKDQLRFVIELCNQNSYTYNKAGTDRVADMILRKIGHLFPVHKTVSQDDWGDHHILKIKDKTEAIYLIGHMDTVFPLDHPFQSCRIEGDRLLGPGTGDMKGGLAVIVYSLLALEAVDLLKGVPGALILNSDEEIGSITSHGIYEKERKNALACLVAECGGLQGEIVISRNGKLGVRIDCFGSGRHVGYGTHEKSSAILELANKVTALEALNACLPGVSLNVGKIEGGLGPSTVSARASALMDVRWVEQEHRDILIDKINMIISTNNQPGCQSEFRVLNERPAMPAHEESQALFRLINDIGVKLGQEIGQEHRRGTSDANFFGSIGVPTIDGFGPSCGDDHTPDEYIIISSLKERTALMALALVAMGRLHGRTC